MYYLCLVSILFVCGNTDLSKSVFPTYSFKNLVFRLSVRCIFLFFPVLKSNSSL